jgi:hypothetical protein
VVVLAAFVFGCTGVRYNMATVELDPDKYEVLGKATSTKTGLMVLNLIPIGQNDKIERAAEEAITSRGGDELINIQVIESWFWAYVLNGYKVSLQGTVVKKT